ncbi:MAG: HD domain-containing protein [Nitrospiraceae bacterium]|nr:HD domain-containing protein [Nitrospiraceae bacterium]
MIALGAGAAVFTLASVQYAREHHDSLRQELLRQVTSLARFPEANPNPIWRLTADAEILYHNPAVHRLLDELQIPHPNACELLPNECETLTRECIENAPHSREAEFEARGRTFHYLFRPFPDEHSVIAAGVDVTYLKRIENELRQLNENLEEKVRERTTELRETQDVTILSLAGLAETRDKETGAHLERTRRYVRMLAQQLRTSPRFRDFLDDRVIEHLFNSAPLHDIGKVGVRDAILLKPGKLTPEEFEEMKQHTIYGGDALRWASERLGFDSFLRLGQDIAYNHHERWDGSGYPRGLKGDEIPWAARLMALADYYDALISKRVYKEAYTHERARTMIIEGQGKHFDPEVVEAFLSREDDFIRVAEEYVDEE